MKRVWIVLTAAMMFLVPVGLSGCETKEKAPETKTVEPEQKEATGAADKSATEHPATDKPKDHPAH